jgi:hypothetical protein
MLPWVCCVLLPLSTAAEPLWKKHVVLDGIYNTTAWFKPG